MLFTDTFSVPAATLKASPVSRTLKIAPGIIHLAEVQFLDGPENEVNIVIKQALHQRVPTNTEASVVGNANTVSASLLYPVEEAPFEVQIEAWSPDAGYAHEITVRLHILPREILQPPLPELGVLKRLGKMLFGGG